MKRKLSNRLIALSLAAVMLIMAGCSAADSSSSTAESSSSEEVTTTTTAQTTATPETTTEQTTTTTAPLMPPMAKPTEELKGFKADGFIANIVNGADNTVIMQTQGYTNNSIYVYDPISDSTVKTMELDSDTETLVGMFQNGTIATYDYNDGVKLKYYRKGKSKPEVIDTKQTYLLDFKADTENNCVYWIDDEGKSIGKIDDSGNVSTVDIEGEISLLSELNTYEHTFLMTSFDENSETGYSMGLFSLDDCKKTADITNGDWSSFASAAGYVNPCAEFTDSGYVTNIDITPLSGDGGKKRYIMDMPKDSYCTFSGDSSCDYAAVTTYDPLNNEYNVSLSFIDLKKGKLAKADLGKGVITSITPFYSKDLRRFIFAASYADGDSTYTRLIMADPSLCDYKTKLKSEEIPNTQSQTYEVGEKFKEVREAADKIEQKYGIRILVGNEVKLSEKSSQYIFVTREENEDPYTVEDELYYLNELDKQLSFYPDGFFKHFKTESGKFGLRLSLVDSLKNDEFTDFEAGGIAFTSGLWYDIAIKTTMLGAKESSLHHEMWHTVENLLNSNGLFDESAWYVFNPDDFVYTSDFDKYATDAEFNESLLEYALSNRTGNTDDVYFVSSYSTVTAMEDRATLIEQVTSIECDYDNDYADYLFGTQNLLKYPHLKAKLDFLAEASKKEFGCVYWESIEKALEKTL
ncbi:MAG: hypothetical protein K6F91_10620 [Ruminococcus sp.]|nr:hypothetical protein [Ruminococcus sp.]